MADSSIHDHDDWQVSWRQCLMSIISLFVTLVLQHIFFIIMAISCKCCILMVKSWLTTAFMQFPLVVLFCDASESLSVICWWTDPYCRLRFLKIWFHTTLVFLKNTHFDPWSQPLRILTNFQNSSPTHSQGNWVAPSSYDRDLHISLTMLLHYLVKSTSLECSTSNWALMVPYFGRHSCKCLFVENPSGSVTRCGSWQ